MKILLIPVWMLTVCLSIFGVIVTAEPAWGDKALYWGGAIFLGLFAPTACLLNEYDKSISANRKLQEENKKLHGWINDLSQ